MEYRDLAWDRSSIILHRENPIIFTGLGLSNDSDLPRTLLPARIPMNSLLRVSVLSLLAFATTAGSAYGDATALPRQGSCPSNYYSSGDYCVPNAGARPAIPRIGSCPSHYYSSGNYCVATDVGGPHAMPRHGSCPSGYYASGDYCVANR